MTAPRTVTRRAPGKLFVVGEYAVMEPGHAAVLVAVDRHVSVTVSASDGPDVVIGSDLVPGTVRLRRSDAGLVGLDDGYPVPTHLSHVVAAIDEVDGLLAERGLRAPPLQLSITSRLHSEGTKLGLGSSGAVTVATVSAVAAFCGIEVPDETRFRLALLATARHGTGSSGGDLAASVWGGWIAYRSPDRAAVLDMAERIGVAETIRAPWPGFRLRRLPPPRGLTLHVGWTGRPASTDSLAGRLGSDWWGSTSQRRFTDRSDECVSAAIRALEQGEDRELAYRVRCARELLADLDDEAGLGVFTPGLAALCEAAEAVGAAAKPSGAGGGDCGIALLDAWAARETTRMRDGWTAAGVLPLPVHVQPATGGTR
ncbi:phosphomevalonate kinase [Actinocorallia sp. API 0066]|uniref:phosphomevalonate kinase n=1 Tax=Actinocorallia sp. API 0066 TaxID=2896846 RepID=UPI001E370C3B|nr:phosphomevalonate kinase [Actinocorallia sp. API 0066]MCD0448647.1 phosphomevalonate kinase [Actinocorallia sp. API 0066]